MHSMPTPVEADDPHDAPVIAPDVIAAARADKVLADITSGTKSHAPDQRPAPHSGGAPALAIDPTYAPAMAAAVYCHAQRHFQGWVPRDDSHRAEGVRLWKDTSASGAPAAAVAACRAPSSVVVALEKACTIPVAA